MNKNITKTKNNFTFKTHDYIKGIWRNWQIFPESSIYNVGYLCTVSKNLNIYKLECSLQKLIDNNINLSSTYFEKDGHLFQQINNNNKLRLKKKLARNEQEKEEIITEIINKPFNLVKGPLFRFTLIKHDFDDEYTFFILYHHIIIDGICFNDLYKELLLLYKGDNTILDFKENLNNYNKYKVWLSDNQNYNTTDISEYYNNIDKEYFSYEIGNKKSNKTVYNFSDFDISSNSLSKNLNDKLTLFSEENNNSVFHILKTAWSILMARYSSQSKITISYALGLRPKKFHMVKGYMVNIIIDQYKEEGNFIEQINNSKKELKKVVSKQRFIPFNQIYEHLKAQLNNDVRNILPQIGFSKISIPYLNIESSPKYKSKIMPQAGEHRIMMQYDANSEYMDYSISYNKDYFDKNTIDDIIENFEFLLEKLITSPNIPTKDICILSPYQYEKIVHKWNKIEKFYPSEKNISQLFEEQVKKTPNNNAIFFKSKNLTYKDLNTKASYISHIIDNTFTNKLKKEIKANRFVGIYMERSPEMIITILAILKSGAICVPIEVSEPNERIKRKIINSECDFIISSSSYIKNFRSLRIPQCTWIDINEEINNNSDELYKYTQKSYQSNEVAFTMYTSGSTGVPKGVLLTHSGIINLIWDHKSRMKLDSFNRILQFSSVSSDVSISTLFCALLTGGCAYVIDETTKKDVLLLQNYIVNNKIDFINIPVSIFALLETNTQLLSTLKTIIIGGEICDSASIKRWQNKVNLFNAYGPTETSITASINKIKTGDTNNKIGRAINNKNLYIADGEMNPVPVGVLGELHIGGDGIAKGYLNNEKLTKKKFIKNPFSLEKKETNKTTTKENRIYKTGDICRWKHDGSIEFIGRRDNQIKIRGYRVELEEIEASLLSHKDITQAIVIFNNNKIIAYYTSEIIIKTEHLRNYISHLLPDYMIPSKFKLVDEFHLNNSGKIDKKLLPAIDLTINENNCYIEPISDIEKKICKICEDILGIEKVGINDHFFHIGGDSIKAFEFIILIKENLNIEIAASHIYITPLLKDLAKELEKEQDYHNTFFYNPNKLNPLYMIPPRNYGSETFLDLAKRLNKYFNCIGFENKNLIYNHKVANHHQLCNYYIKNINLADTSQPIYLMGFSFGGQLALETASILEKKGFKNISIILLDTILINKAHKSLHNLRLKYCKICYQTIKLIYAAKKRKTLIYKQKYHLIKDINEQMKFYDYSKKLKHSRILLFKATRDIEKDNEKIQDSSKNNFFFLFIRMIFRFSFNLFINKYNNVDNISSEIKKISIRCKHANMIYKETDIITGIKEWIYFQKK